MINPNLVLAIRRLPNARGLPLPDYQTPGAAGMDLFAAIEEDEIKIWPGEIKWIETGIAVEIPHGCEGQVRPRSSMGRRGLIITNAPGTIDCDYRGEIKILLSYIGENHGVIRRGDRIAQLIIAPVLQLPVVEVDHLTETVRGERGFGSTGR